MLYASLLQHRRKRILRTVRSKYRWIAAFGLGLLGAYVAFVLAAAGFVFTEILQNVYPGADPAAFVNAHLLTVFAGLFLVRFFLQHTPGMPLTPYLHLPIPVAKLVRLFQIDALLSVHNLFPLLFLVPFWLRHVMPEASAIGAAAWLTGSISLVALSHFGNVLLRIQMSGTSRGFIIAVASIAVLSLLDQIAGTTLVNQWSSALFGALAAGNGIIAAALGLGVVFLYVHSSRLLWKRLKASDAPAGKPIMGWNLPFVPERGPVVNLMLLELKLMWRNKRPRVFFLSAVILGVVYVLTMLLYVDRFSDPFSRSVIGIFASGIFTLNYGQLMFSWESTYYDGFLARAHTPRDLVRAKMLLLQFSSVVFFLLSAPLFLVLTPELLLFHVAFLSYNVGVTSVLIIALAISNQKRVDLGRSGMLLNYEGFSLAHFLWFVPTLVPPALILYGTASAPQTGLFVIGGLGLLGTAVYGFWHRLFARQLVRRKYVMASGFRRYDP